MLERITYIILMVMVAFYIYKFKKNYQDHIISLLTPARKIKIFYELWDKNYKQNGRYGFRREEFYEGFIPRVGEQLIREDYEYGIVTVDRVCYNLKEGEIKVVSKSQFSLEEMEEERRRRNR